MRAIRQRRVFGVAIAGLLVSIGTGDYDPPARSATGGMEILPGQAVTVRVTANQDALVAQGDFYAELEATSTSPVDATLRAVPEDFDVVEAAELVLRSKPSTRATAGAGGRMEDDGGADEDAGPRAPGGSVPSVTAEAILWFDRQTCPKTGLCERIFRVERSDGAGASGNAVRLTVVAKMVEQNPKAECSVHPQVPGSERTLK